MRRNLSLLYKNTGASFQANGDRDAALNLYKKAMAIDEADSSADPDDTEVRVALSSALGSIGFVLMNDGEMSGALGFYRKALELRLSVASADPQNAFARGRTAAAYEQIGFILAEMGDSRGALQNYKEMEAIYESLKDFFGEARACAKIADLCSRRGSQPHSTNMERSASLRDAVSWYRKSLDLLSYSPDQTSDAVVKEKDRITKEIDRCETVIGNRR
jgi:tetratricopeptide (TPR) repeat protein